MGRPAEQPAPSGSNIKGLAATIASVFAALVSIASFARSLGFIGGANDAALAMSARWIGVAPAQDTAFAIGDTIYLAATVTGRAGATLVGVPIGWSSDIPSVATVSEEGVVIARAPGTTTIVAAVGTLAARSRITVKQRVAHVRIAGDSTVTAGEATRTPIAMRATDARGHVIQGVTARWTSSDTSVAHVDSAGHLVALRPGQIALTAVVEGITAQAPVTIAPTPGALRIVSGGDQRARAGSSLKHPIAVRVLDRRGAPIAGAPVRFRDPNGASTLEPSIVFTDVDGHARTTWTLAPVPGRQRALATVDHVDSALVILAEAEPIPENLRVTVSGGGQKATVAAALADPVVVKLTDSTGRALADVPVTWQTKDGGRLEPGTARTDTLGVARTSWTLGRRAGQQQVIVRVATDAAIPADTLTVTARPAAPTRLTIASGASQSARVGDTLAQPVSIRIADSLGNVVPGVAITLATTAGSLDRKSATSDSTGTIAVRWTLGRAAGVQRFTARAAGLDTPLEVSATAMPAPPAAVAFAELPADGVAGTRLKDTVWVTVTDSFGNPIPKAQVVFTATAGTLTAARVSTDARGRAATRWTLGKAAGSQTVSAVVRGTTVKAARAIRARAPAATRPAATRGTTRPSGGAAAPTSPVKKG